MKRYRTLAAGKQAPGTVQAGRWVLIPFLGPNYTMSRADAQGGWAVGGWGRMEDGEWRVENGEWMLGIG